MSELTDRLRAGTAKFHQPTDMDALMDEAADEIDRLEASAALLADALRGLLDDVGVSSSDSDIRFAAARAALATYDKEEG